MSEVSSGYARASDAEWATAENVGISWDARGNAVISPLPAGSVVDAASFGDGATLANGVHTLCLYDSAGEMPPIWYHRDGDEWVQE